MIDFHLYSEKKCREGTYQVRIYSVPIGANVSLSEHWNHIQSNAEMVTVASKLIDPLPDREIEAESEFAQGIPSIGTYKLSISADPVFLPIVRAARDMFSDIWIEVVLDQLVLDCPERPAGASVLWPRKRRSVYWGMLDRSTLHGTVNVQRFEGRADNSLLESSRPHIGSLTMEFVHWLKVSGGESVKDWLDSFYNDSWNPIRLTNGADAFYDAGSFLRQIVENIAPTKLLSMSDVTLRDLRSANIVLPESISADGTVFKKLLSDQYIRVVHNVGGVGVAPLFSNDTNGPGTDSLYKWKDFAQALFEWCREFFLFPQVEIPAMDDAAAVDNAIPYVDQSLNDANWKGVTRFLFLPLDKSSLEMRVDHNRDAVEYDVSGSFASSYKVDQPGSDKLLPAPGYSTAYSQMAGGSDESYKTLLRFVGRSYLNGVLTDDIRGYELWQQVSPDNYLPSRYVLNATQTGGFQSWAGFHAFSRISVWGSVRSLLEIDCKQIGVEEFGATVQAAGEKISPIDQTFGFWDFGDFPLYRTMDARVGLMANPIDDDQITYLTISVKQTPDGGKHVKLLEISPIVDPIDGEVVDAAAPPDPDPPVAPDTTPPTMVITKPLPSGSVTGVSTVKVTATDDGGIAQVNIKFDGKLAGVLVKPSSGNSYNFTLDTTGSTTGGSHTLTAEAFDTSGNMATQTIPVTV